MRRAGPLSICLWCGHLALAQTPGLVPLSDLGLATYHGEEGGLYPGGENVPPLAHLDAAMARAAAIVPRAASGEADAQGWIVLLAIGMSNTNQEFAVFERQEDAAADRNGRVVLVDGAVGGQDASTIADPAAGYWTVVMQRLGALGLSAAQVQVAWLKEEEQGPWTGWPDHPNELRQDLESIAVNLHDKFPNLKLCYLSSRIYGGYSGAGEPKAYESGFSVKWLIRDQIDGDPGLNYGQVPGPVRSPLLLWGPYLWANGPTPRSDGLVWLASDLEGDFTHPSPSGEQKVADLLSAFFDAEPTATLWWPRRAGQALLALDATNDAHVSAASPATNFGSSALLLVQGGASPTHSYLGFDLPSLGAPVELAKLSLRVTTLGQGGGPVRGVADTSWTEGGITWNTAPAFGPALANVPQASRDGTLAAAVTAAVNAGLVDFALTPLAAAQAAYTSREAGQPPRLVLAVSCAGGGPPGLPDGDGDGSKDACDCAPDDATAFAEPAEIENLRWLDAESMAWDPDDANSGSATRYDVMSGDISEVGSLWTSPSDACMASGLASATTADTTPALAPDAGRFFLVRGDNPCGAGRWETASDGRDRMTGACP